MGSGSYGDEEEEEEVDEKEECPEWRKRMWIMIVLQKFFEEEKE